jgi:hypothetical protein
MLTHEDLPVSNEKTNVSPLKDKGTKLTQNQGMWHKVESSIKIKTYDIIVTLGAEWIFHIIETAYQIRSSKTGCNVTLLKKNSDVSTEDDVKHDQE